MQFITFLYTIYTYTHICEIMQVVSHRGTLWWGGCRDYIAGIFILPRCEKVIFSVFLPRTWKTTKTLNPCGVKSSIWACGTQEKFPCYLQRELIFLPPTPQSGLPPEGHLALALPSLLHNNASIPSFLLYSTHSLYSIHSPLLLPRNQ